ncbi:alcohol dehydrogenase [Brevibacterium daeguense]|uniref:Alcohol dehydrogenase n=1 Tax=Brevibacterium daeguense TaxID=909936 RepID=A0ABP8EFD6_9MICO
MKTFAVPAQNASVVEREVESPAPEGGQVLLRVLHAGVCHTDTHVQEGGYDLGGRGFLEMTTRGLEYPAVMGHETVGEVIAVGDQVTGVAPGDVRLIYPWIGCGECVRCQQGEENYCAASRALGIFTPGGFAEEILVPHERYLVDIDGLDPAWAATLACSGLTAYSSARKALAHVSADETVAVIGAGGVGLMAIAVLGALGHRSIAAVDVRDENLTVARELGATITVNSSNGNGVEALTSAAGGPIASVIDFVNTGATVGLGFDALAKGGTFVHVGLFGGEFALPTALMAIKALVLQGNYVGSLQELREVVDIAKQGRLPKIPILSGPLSADGVNAGLTGLRDGTVAGRTVLSRV